MLAVIGTHSPPTGTLVVDSVVPFSFHLLEGTSVQDSITWHYADNSGGIFEFQIDRQTGEIYGITLVSSLQPFDQVKDLPCGLFDKEFGIPVTNASAVKGKVFRQHVRVRLLRSNGGVCAVWGKWASATKCLAVDRVRFLLRMDELVGVCFVSLTPEEIATVNQWDELRKRED